MTPIKYRNYIPIAITLILVIVAFLIVRPLLISIFLGGLLAYLLYPLHRTILKKIKNKTLSSLIICSLVVLVVVVPGFFFVRTLVSESYVLYLLVKQRLAVGIFEGCTHNICQVVESFSQTPGVQFQIQEATKFVTDWIIRTGSNALVTVPRILLNLLVMFFTLFYFLNDGKAFMLKLEGYFSYQHKKYLMIIKRLKEIVDGVVYGYLFVALLQGALGALGFFIFGVPSPIFWGVVMAFLALIPLLGTGAIWGPAAAILFLNGLFQNSNSLVFKGIGLLIYSVIFVASLDNFIRPKLIGDKAKVHPALVLVGIFGGILFFGPLGVIVGPLILSLTAVSLETYIRN